MFPDLTLFYMSIYGGFGFDGPACFAYLGLATGLPQTGNPPFAITDFLNQYPQFAGPPLSSSAVLVQGTPTVAVPNSTGMLQGQLITGSGVPNGSVLLAVVTNPIAITGDLTLNSQAVINVSSVAGLLVGQPIAGANVPPGSTIAAIGTNTLMLSANATATAPATALTVTGSELTLSAPATASGTVTVAVFTAPPVAPAVIQMFLNLAYASLMSSRWREAWAIAMGWYIAHFVTLYMQAAGSATSTPGQIVAAGLERGIVASKSADGLALSYTQVPGLEAWAAWNKTTFGTQLATMARCVGAGPIYVR